MNFICRERVLEVLKRYVVPAALRRDVEELFYFPTVPDQRDLWFSIDGKDGRNVIGQTEAEFWAAVEMQDK